MIKIQDITIQFPSITPFNEYTLTIARGEKCVICGPSGRGKSTLLNIIMGFILPSRGTISVNDTPLTPHTAASIRQQTAFIPQDITFTFGNGKDLLLHPFTFKENRHKTPSIEQIQQTTRLLMLDDVVLQQPVHQLSGGQRQRLLIASALLSDKPIFLWDEPSSALDKESTIRVLDALDQLPNTTLISVSHDPVWIERMQTVITI